MYKKTSVLRIPFKQKLCSIEAVVFDLDGTLYPQKAVKKAMIRALFPRLIFLKKYSDYRCRVVGRDFGGAEAMKNDAITTLSNGNEKKAGKWEKWLRKRYYPALLKSISGITPRPGFIELIRDLHKKGIILAIVSDYGYVKERLSSLGFDPEMFSILLGTEDIGAMKPAARINSVIRSELGVKPSRTLLVGDRDDTDRTLADEGGMLFMGISDSQDKSVLDNTWYSWAALKEIFNEALIR